MYATARVETASWRVALVPGGSVERAAKRRWAMDISAWKIVLLLWASCPMACSGENLSGGECITQSGGAAWDVPIRVTRGTARLVGEAPQHA